MHDNCHGRDKEKQGQGSSRPLVSAVIEAFGLGHGRKEMTGCGHPVFHGRDRPLDSPSRLFSFLKTFYKVPSRYMLLPGPPT